MKPTSVAKPTSVVKPKPSERPDVPVVLVLTEAKKRELIRAFNIPPLYKPNIIHVNRYATIRFDRSMISVKCEPSKCPDLPVVEEKRCPSSSAVLKPNILKINRDEILQKLEIQMLSTTQSKAALAKRPETLVEKDFHEVGIYEMVTEED